MPPFDPVSTVAELRGDEWVLASGDGANKTVVARFPRRSVRISVSWKAFVFETQATVLQVLIKEED